MVSVATLMNNNKDKNYHLGHFFMDVVKMRPPEGIFQRDAATGDKETNASVLSRSVQLARCFLNLGLKPGDVMALGGRNHLDLHIPYYAALLTGLPIVGVDPYFKYDEIKHLFENTEPKIAFCQSETRELYEKAAHDLELDVKIVTFDGHGCTLSQFVETYKDNATEEFQPVEFDTDKIYAWLVSTSGTTGLPKVAAFKHKPLITQMLGFIALSPAVNDGKKLGFNMAPVQWISAYFNALGMPAMNLVKLQTSTPDDIEHVIDVINEYKPVNMMSSPSTLSSILQHGKACDMSCFNVLTVTGAKVYKELIVELKSRLRAGAYLLEAYGQTETIGPVLMPNPLGPLGSCGVPIPGSTKDIKLVNPETEEDITEPNVTGELWYKGLSFSEYYKNPEETAKAFTKDGWYKTGDLLYRDENNNYFFVDRLKMLIKYRNYHINPNELEELIMQLEGVLEVSVLGIPDETDSEHAVACVVRHPACDVTARQVKDIVANTLSPTKQLRGGVVFLDALPKTSSGKVARAQLKTLVRNAQRE